MYREIYFQLSILLTKFSPTADFQVQNNKQGLSALRRKTSEGIDDLRPQDSNTRINARWTNDELLLAVQGLLLYYGL